MANPVLPLDGNFGVRGLYRPTLIPNFDRNQLINGATTHMSPAAFAAANPRVAATVVATASGTPATGDTVALTLTFGSQSFSHTYTVGASDTLDTIADGVANLFNSDPAVRGQDIYAGTDAAVITFNWGGPIGNTAVASVTVTTTGSLAVAFTPSNGDFSGGSGPIYIGKNFNFTYNGSTMAFYYGEPYQLSQDLVNKMVTQGMPIV